MLILEKCYAHQTNPPSRMGGVAKQPAAAGHQLSADAEQGFASTGFFVDHGPLSHRFVPCVLCVILSS